MGKKLQQLVDIELGDEALSGFIYNHPQCYAVGVYPTNENQSFVTPTHGFCTAIAILWAGVKKELIEEVVNQCNLWVRGPIFPLIYTAPEENDPMGAFYIWQPDVDRTKLTRILRFELEMIVGRPFFHLLNSVFSQATLDAPFFIDPPYVTLEYKGHIGQTRQLSDPDVWIMHVLNDIDEKTRIYRSVRAEPIQFLSGGEDKPAPLEVSEGAYHEMLSCGVARILQPSDKGFPEYAMIKDSDRV